MYLLNHAGTLNNPLVDADVRNKRSYECGDKLFEMIMANLLT
jgi:hypothetical protein